MIKESETQRLAGLKICITLMILLAIMLTLTLTAGADDTDNPISGVVVVVNGSSNTPVMISGKTTVDEVLEKLGSPLGSLDEVTPAADSYVNDGDIIKVIRREYLNNTVSGVVEHETIYFYSDEVDPGKETVVQEGKAGEGTQTFKQLVENGEVIEETLVSESLAKEPITERIAIGFASRPVSDFNFDWEFNADREPTGIVSVLRNKVATAYTAGTGARTASGLPAQIGHVAVNPNVIPYGSKLFIQSSDGKKIYGYAIAADTGGALASGSAHVDLFFATIGECVVYGVGEVDIFVLETP